MRVDFGPGLVKQAPLSYPVRAPGASPEDRLDLSPLADPALLRRVDLGLLAQPQADRGPLLQAQKALATSLATAWPPPVSPLREPEEAVEIVNRFNQELHFEPDVLRRRQEITVSSPAKFFRVNPALFYDDVLGVYFPMSNLLDREAPPIIIAGDCHLGNLGTMRAADGSTFWGVNDFDMAGRGSPEDDLERMATSLVLMSQGGPLSDADLLRLIDDLASAYLKELSIRAQQGPAKLAGLSLGEARGDVAQLISERSQVNQQQMLGKIAEPDGRRFLRTKELVELGPEEHRVVKGVISQYERTQGSTPELKRPLQVLDIARKTDSGGSTYGLKRYYLLVEASEGPPRVLELKQELPTAPELSTGNPQSASAQHIFSSMAALGGTFDPMMASAQMEGDAYYIRERHREKASLAPGEFRTLQQWQDLVQQAAVALARAHAHQPGVARSICDWVGPDQDLLIRRLQSFSLTYARQTELDCAAFARAHQIKSGS